MYVNNAFSLFLLTYENSRLSDPRADTTYGQRGDKSSLARRSLLHRLTTHDDNLSLNISIISYSQLPCQVNNINF